MHPFLRLGLEDVSVVIDLRGEVSNLRDSGGL